MVYSGISATRDSGARKNGPPGVKKSKNNNFNGVLPFVIVYGV